MISAKSILFSPRRVGVSWNQSTSQRRNLTRARRWRGLRTDCIMQSRIGESDMIEAVIWDFGGVFTASPFEAFARYERERGIAVGAIRKINTTNHHDNAWAKFERAEVDFAGFDALFAAEARLLGFEIPGRDVLQLLAGEFRPEMIEALRRIKTRFKTGCITNNMPSDALGTSRSIYALEVM